MSWASENDEVLQQIEFDPVWTVLFLACCVLSLVVGYRVHWQYTLVDSWVAETFHFRDTCKQMVLKHLIPLLRPVVCCAIFAPGLPLSIKLYKFYHKMDDINETYFGVFVIGTTVSDYIFVMLLLHWHGVSYMPRSFLLPGLCLSYILLWGCWGVHVVSRVTDDWNQHEVQAYFLSLSILPQIAVMSLVAPQTDPYTLVDQLRAAAERCTSIPLMEAAVADAVAVVNR